MNKKFIYFLVSLVGIFVIAGTAFALTIPNPLPGINSFGQLLTRIAGEVGKLVVILSSVAIIFAGGLFLLSGGSPEKITKAKSALMYAIIGTVIGLAATAIVEIIKSVIGAK